MFKLKDRTIVVTGGTSDIGRSLAINLSASGADVALLDQNPEKGRRIADEVNEYREAKEANGRAVYFEVDLRSPGQVREVLSRVSESFGGIDVLVNGLQTSKVSFIDAADYLVEFERLIDINTRSAVYTTHGAIPFMKGRKRGKVIFLIPDLVRWGSEGESLTAVTRGGIIYYARSMARELAQYNIAVNCVAVGPTEDYLLSRDPQATSIKVTEQKLMAAMPMGRTLNAEEISQTICFLASSLSDAVTGQTWAVNGGLTMF